MKKTTGLLMLIFGIILILSFIGNLIEIPNRVNDKSNFSTFIINNIIIISIASFFIIKGIKYIKYKTIKKEGIDDIGKS